MLLFSAIVSKTHGYQKTRNVKIIPPTTYLFSVFIKIVIVDLITFLWTEASDLKTRSMVDSVAISG